MKKLFLLMGLIGKISKPEGLKDIKRGQKVYVNCEELLVGRTDAYMHINTFYYLESEVKSNTEKENLLIVTRIGDGLSENDFDVEVTPNHWVNFLYNEDEDDIRSQLAEYIVFHDYEYETITEDELDPLAQELQDLKKKLEKSKNEQNWEEAATLRDKITNVRKKIREKKNKTEK